MTTFTLMPFLLALVVAVAAMPTHVYQVCAWNVGTLALEPWRVRAAAAICRSAGCFRAWLARLSPLALCCAAGILIALLVTQDVAASGWLLAAFPPAMVARREQLLREADALRSPDGTFPTDAAREKFDQLLTEVEALDGHRQGPAAEIYRMVATAGLESDFARRLVADGVTIERARSLVFDRLATRSDATRIDSHVTFGDDGASTRMALMAEALAARFGGPAPSNAAREFTHYRAVDIARECLEARGVATRLLSPSKIIARALHTTSDFPSLLTDTGNRILRKGYASYAGGVRRVCKQSTARDFRAKAKLLLGEAPALVEVNQHGEVTRGTMAESKESYSLKTFARIFGITRQALVNDDLDAFGNMMQKLGRAAAEFEASQLVTLLTSNPAMADGVTLFHADHGNLGTPGAISVSTLGEALKLMRLQKGLDGVTPIDVTPKYLVLPAEKEVLGRQYVAQINAAKSSDVNPFSADLEPVVDPRLDSDSTTAWYVAADPELFDTIEYSYLEDEPGPVIESRAGFDVEGVEFKVRVDFGCGAIDYRGLVKNAGA